jgi:hypothetical protein
MIDADDKIALSMFERKAGDCSTVKDAVDLCNRFLEKHGPKKIPSLVDLQQDAQQTMAYGGGGSLHHGGIAQMRYDYVTYPPAPLEKRTIKEPYIFMNTQVVSERDRVMMTAMDMAEYKAALMRAGLNSLMTDMVDKGYVDVKQQHDFASMSERLILRIGAYKL